MYVYWLGCFCFSLTSLYVGCEHMILGGQNLLSRVYCCVPRQDSHSASVHPGV